MTGETGTGKELIARATHQLSGRKGAFVPINCGALPASLLEAELFGYRRGAFSGANEDRIGLVRFSDAGTLFLDGIAELPPAGQTALLRALQEREVRAIGDVRASPVDLRWCSPASWARGSRRSGEVPRRPVRASLWLRRAAAAAGKISASSSRRCWRRRRWRLRHGRAATPDRIPGD